MRATPRIDAVMRTLGRAIHDLELPAVEKIAENSEEDPFEVLIATMLSAQTRDAVTAAASARLFAAARTPQAMARLSETQIIKLIFPVSFYRHKAAHVRAMFVRPEWTRRGLGRAILQAGHDAARAEGFTRLDLGATLPGVALYHAFGFEAVRPFVVTMPDGVRLDAVEMARPIDL